MRSRGSLRAAGRLQPTPGMRMPDQSLLDVSAAAAGLDADFWSLRFVEETCESFSVQRNVQQPWAVSTDRGVMASVYAGGGYGYACLLYTSDAADERSSVDLGGRRIIKKK